MAWSGANTAVSGAGDGAGRSRRGKRRAGLWQRRVVRRGLRRGRRAAVLAVVQSLLASGLAPVAAVAAGAAAVTAASIVSTATPARASISGSALILATSVNGGSSSAEAQAASALGLSVTVEPAATWDTLSTASFKGYSVIIIGDPSTSSCSLMAPADALSTAGTWGPAVNGNVAVLGTAPALGGGNTLISDAIAYAATGTQGTTGLYASLNCDYSTQPAGTDVALLDSVEGGGFTVTGQGGNCPSDAGTVNTWQALALTWFNGLTSANLGPWSSPACSVQESFTAWPAGLAGLALYTGASPATFTASDGATGQAYILAGAPVPNPTAQLAVSRGGQVPVRTISGGGSNLAAPGVSQPVAGGVNTENGDFTQSATDFSIPAFGPSLDFTRTYDAQVAQQQTQTGKPGPMGYGWTDNWATSLSAASPVPADIYTLDGLRADTGQGGPATSAPLNRPEGVKMDGSDAYIADTAGNRIEEIPATSKTQWGVTMTAGDIYTIAGSDTGTSGESGNGTAARQALLNGPTGITLDQGNLYIADTGNHRVLEIPATSGTQRGQSMTLNDIYRVAGTGTAGVGADSQAATSSALNAPMGLAVDGSHDLYIADYGNNRIQEVASAGGTQWNQSMTANFVYTVAGSAAGTSGISGDGGLATSAFLRGPQGVGIGTGGSLYIADTFNNRVQEVAAATGNQWGGPMTVNDIYTIAGYADGSAGVGGDGVGATGSHLDQPTAVKSYNGGNLYIADSLNNRIQEVAVTSHTEWGQSMTANDVYTVAGSAAGTAGFSGDGGASTSALLTQPHDVAMGNGSNLFITDTSNNEARQVASATAVISRFAGGAGTFAAEGNGGPAINAGLNGPGNEAFDAAGDVFIADSSNNRVQEIAAAPHTQFGITMIAGDVYTVAGQANGTSGRAGDGSLATSAYLNNPVAVAVDGAGNLYITDLGNNRIQKVSASTGNISTIAGQANGAPGISGDGGPATSAYLSAPIGVALDAAGDVFIADNGNNRIQEVFATGGQNFGQSMTAGDIYTIAGSISGTSGVNGDGGPATSALLNSPTMIGTDQGGNLYIADRGNNRIQEVPVTTATQRGQPMTAYGMYTIAGSATGGAGIAGDGGPATSALLNFVNDMAVDPSGNVYIADTDNNRFQEVPAANGTQWGQSMTANDMYTVAGSATGASGGSGGDTGDGGPATSALIWRADTIALDPAGDMYITDWGSNLVREVTSATPPTITPAPGLTSALSPAPGGITITQPGGAQITFYAQTSGCSSPYFLAGQYCVLLQNVGASLSYDSTHGVYTFTPQPGTSYTYNNGGNLTGISDVSSSGAAVNTLAVASGTPAPGSGNCPSTATWCQTITAANGRALTVGYKTTTAGSITADVVTSVTDPLGRRWAYAYTGFDLTSVTDPIGTSGNNPAAHTASYTYGVGSTGNPLNANDLLTITSPNGQPGGPNAGAHTTVIYNASGQVTSQTDPMGFQTTYDWSAFNPSTGNGAITVHDPDGNKTVYDYSQGTLAAHATWTGTTLTSEQDYLPDQAVTNGDTSSGTQLVTTSADGNGNITTTTYDTSGNPVTTTAPDGVDPQPTQTTQQFTSLNQPDCTSAVITASTCPNSPGPAPVLPGGTITPPSSVPPLGITWTQYDNYGNQLWTTTGVYPPNGATASYAQTTYQLFKGNSITLGSNNITCNATPPAASLPCAKINADGVVTQLAYNPQGDLTSSSTPDGNGSELATTTYGYDGSGTASDGEQTTTTSPDGNLTGANAANHTTVTAYNADGQKTTVTQAGGIGATVTPRTTSYGYDPNGNQTTVQDARGYTTTTTFNVDDRATLITDPDNNATLTCYDGADDTTETVPPTGVAANNLTPASCPSSYPSGYQSTPLAADATMYIYDANGNQTQMTTPAPVGQTGFETTSYTYDGNGNVTKTTAPPTSNGGPSQITVDSYNPAGKLSTETTGYNTTAAATVSYCYNPEGGQTSVVYPDGNTSGIAQCESSYPWAVSANVNPTQASYQTTSSYDSASEMVSTTSPQTAAAPSGATTTSTYDPAGNMLTRVDPNGVTITWTYTPLGKPASVSYSGSSAHSVTYTYDAEGNKTGMVDATGTSGYSYDPFSELTSTTNGAGQTTGYGYDADGNATSILYPLPPSATWATTSTVTYGHDHADMLTSVSDFNGNTITIGDSADGLPVSAALGSTGDTITITYDNAGGPSVIALKNNPTTLQSFTYTDAPAGNVLSEADTPTSSQSPAVYTYDAKNRVTSMTPGTGSTRNYGFDASSNLTTLPTGGTGTYDNAGELTSAILSGTATSYTYNADGQRLTATQGSTTTASGAWNGAGRLTSYSDAAANMSAATYDGDGFRASTTVTPSGGSAVTQGYVWNTTDSIPRLIMDSSNAYIAGVGLAPVEQVNLSSGAITYLVNDSLGSVRGIVSSTGSLTATTAYDAWGDPETAGGLSATTPFGYAGGYTDPTGLVYLINRYYDPATGQFTSVDPAIADTLQPYAYAAGNPVTSNDPTGLRGLSGAVAYYWTDFQASRKFNICFALGISLPFCKFTVGVALLWREIDLYLNSSQTERLASDIGNASGWSGGLGVGIAVPGLLDKAAFGEIGLAIGGYSFYAFLFSVSMQQADRKGGNNGVILSVFSSIARLHYSHVPFLGSGYIYLYRHTLPLVVLRSQSGNFYEQWWL